MWIAVISRIVMGIGYTLFMLTEVECHPAALFQSSRCPQVWTYWRRPAWSAEQPDALRGTGGCWSPTLPECVRQWLWHCGWHRCQGLHPRCWSCSGSRCGARSTWGKLPLQGLYDFMYLHYIYTLIFATLHSGISLLDIYGIVLQLFVVVGNYGLVSVTAYNLMTVPLILL